MSNENNVVEGIDKTINGDGFKELLKVLKNNPSAVFSFFSFISFPLIILLLFGLLGFSSYQNRDDRISMQGEIKSLTAEVQKLNIEVQKTNNNTSLMVDVLQDIKSEIIRKGKE